MADKSISLLKLVEQRASRKEELEEEKRKRHETLIPYLPTECISNILVRLPHESLQRSRFVCKTWYRIINSTIFIEAYLQRSESVLVFLHPSKRDTFFPYSRPNLQEKPNAFSVESKLFQLQSVPVRQQPLIDPSLLLHIKFMEIENGKMKIEEYNTTCLGTIRGAGGGLIVLDDKMKNGGLIVMNPVTKELTALPSGSLCSPHNESYGLAFCQTTRNFKLVHLFQGEMQFVSCEILDLGAKSWRIVDGPAFRAFRWFVYDPVFAIGAIHWVPKTMHSKYIVYMTVDDEKFHRIPLPRRSKLHDRIMEMHGGLGFVTRKKLCRIDVWILRNLCGDGWTKQYSITVDCNSHLIPLYSSRICGEMIFEDKDGSLYAYDCSLQNMRKVEMQEGSFPVVGHYFAHVNSLLSWKIQGNVID
ncbi:putative F-box protein At3g17265 isoform X2 [Coffea eugenioides]|uniref:putative F-box protein At3g17265 isoform X2 n=1 Tax=Coffea eugenioides TaxID=49369 RepID=UPI000F613A6E|nr:putative F-box protein At3g17265 isoform X2 [Coffea eugenioides]XP_027149111.1 putative F-box protein At3g17265 isoform X2 [Coffea eugenioides]